MMERERGGFDAMDFYSKLMQLVTKEEFMTSSFPFGRLIVCF
jgi:hypothetical protein